MRLYPPVWSMGRYVDNDYTLGKYTIPAGSTIMMSQFLMHRDPRYYSEPERFNPERWSSEAKSILPRFSYFPFWWRNSRLYRRIVCMDGRYACHSNYLPAMENAPRPRSSCRT
jgi:cytochrome P450